MKSSQIGRFLDRLEALIDAGKAIEPGSDEKPFNELDPQAKLTRTLETIATDLLANKANRSLPSARIKEMGVQQTALRINAKLGNIGETLMLLDIPDATSSLGSIRLMIL